MDSFQISILQLSIMIFIKKNILKLPNFLIIKQQNYMVILLFSCIVFIINQNAFQEILLNNP